MAGSTEIDVTGPARWFRLLWWFPYRYLLFFFAIPGIFLLFSNVPRLLSNSATKPDYWNIIEATSPAIVVGTIAFPLLGFIGFHLTGKMSRQTLAVAVPLLLASCVPYYMSASGLYAEIRQGGVLPYVYFKIAEMIGGPVLIIGALRLMWLRFGRDGRIWQPFRDDRIFLGGGGRVTWRKFRVGLLTAGAVTVALFVFEFLRLQGDHLAKRWLAPSLHKGAENFFWYATTDPAVSEGYVKLLLNSPGARSFFFANLAWWAVAAAIAVVVFRFLLRYIRRYNAKAWSEDPREPILLLRSFGDDAASVWPTAVFRQLTGRRYRLEEAIADELDDLGPVVAVGQPGEWLPPLGAWREELADDQWQARVLELMDKSQLILLIAGTTHWVKWELDQALARGHADKVIIGFPSAGAGSLPERFGIVEDGWRAATGEPFSGPSNLAGLRIVHFLPGGDVVCLKSSGGRQSDYQMAVRLTALQKHDAGVSLGRAGAEVANPTTVRTGFTLFGQTALWGVAWLLTAAILWAAALQPDLKQLRAEVETCASLAGAPWDPAAPGKVEFQQLDHRRAIEVCQATLRKAPDNLSTHFQLARALQAAGRLEEARRHFEALAAAGYGAAMNSLGLMILDDKTQVGSERDQAALRWFDAAVAKGVRIALLGRVRVYGGNKEIDPNGRRAAGNFLIAVASDIYQARAQLVGGLKPFGFDGRFIKANEQILANLGVFPEKPDETFSFESLQAAAVLFTDEAKAEPAAECLSVGPKRVCFK